MERKTRRRLLASTLATLAVLAAGELYFRSRVPACGITPFRASAIPGLSCELRPSFETLYKGHVVRTNSLGLRGGEVRHRVEGELRVALVGDSMTFGSCVALEDTLGAHLERELGARAQVLNLGVPGYTASDAALVVEHKLAALAPDVVVYVWYANDVEPARRWDAIPEDAVIDDRAGFALRSALLEWVKLELKDLGFALGFSLAKRTSEFSRSEWEQGGGERVAAALSAMRAACDARGMRLCFAAYPHMQRASESPFRVLDELALAKARELGIEAVDLAAAFEPDEDLSVYWANLYDHHPGGAAHAKVARLLARELTRSGDGR